MNNTPEPEPPTAADESPIDRYVDHRASPLGDPGRRPLIRALMQVLWPAFLAAAVTVGIVFSVIDPLDIRLGTLEPSEHREGIYTVGFLFFWLMYSGACALSWYLASSDHRTVSGHATGSPARAD